MLTALIGAVCADGPREQAYIERSIRDIIENTKLALEDARKDTFVHIS
jgi:hypothetical protein